MDAEVKAQIEQILRENDVLLFMKGTPTAPACGFSATVAEILDGTLGKGWASVDVLSHPAVREGIKEYSSWPTIPQLYVKEKFIGGADIISQLHEDGSLEEALGLDSEIPIPTLNLSPRAKEALQGYLGDSGEVVILEVGRDYQANLSLAPRPSKGIVVDVDGIQFALDRISASRADGTAIDFIETDSGPAFKVNNPNEPAKVTPLSVQEFQRWRSEGKSLRLLDVRPQAEAEKASLDGAELLYEGDKFEEVLEEPLDTVLVMLCHHGHRSRMAGEKLLTHGFRQVYNLEGGIDAWSSQVDSKVPRY